MRETHPFGYHLPANADKLIIGSFPCFNGKDYGDWFYSGSGKSDFWSLLSKIFNLPASTLDQKKFLCDINNIAITDIATTIERKKNSCKDSDVKIIEYNTDGIGKCLTSGIKLVLFTSKFVENHFKRLYPNFTIRLVVLISPSPSARIYIASLQEYKDMMERKEIDSTYEYKLLKYRKALVNDNR